MLVSRLGAAAVEALADEDSGKMVGLCGDENCRVPLDEVVGEQRPLDPDLYRLAGVLAALPSKSKPRKDQPMWCTHCHPERHSVDAAFSCLERMGG